VRYANLPPSCDKHRGHIGPNNRVDHALTYWCSTAGLYFTSGLCRFQCGNLVTGTCGTEFDLSTICRYLPRLVRTKARTLLAGCSCRVCVFSLYCCCRRLAITAFISTCERSERCEHTVAVSFAPYKIARTRGLSASVRGCVHMLLRRARTKLSHKCVLIQISVVFRVPALMIACVYVLQRAHIPQRRRLGRDRSLLSVEDGLVMIRCQCACRRC
jgi:hypothetical protein